MPLCRYSAPPALSQLRAMVASDMRDPDCFHCVVSSLCHMGRISFAMWDIVSLIRLFPLYGILPPLLHEIWVASAMWGLRSLPLHENFVASA